MGTAIEKRIPRLAIVAPYFASIIRALHIEVGDNMDIDRNSVAAI
jgi:hypothetical protein